MQELDFILQEVVLLPRALLVGILLVVEEELVAVPEQAAVKEMVLVEMAIHREKVIFLD